MIRARMRLKVVDFATCNVRAVGAPDIRFLS